MLEEEEDVAKNEDEEEDCLQKDDERYDKQDHLSILIIYIHIQDNGEKKKRKQRQTTIDCRLDTKQIQIKHTNTRNQSAKHH